jgi:hypothetical protein
MAREVVGSLGCSKGSASFSGRSGGWEQNDATSNLPPDHEILGNGQYVGSTEVVELDSSPAHEELEKALASPSLRVFGWKDIGLGEYGKMMSISIYCCILHIHMYVFHLPSTMREVHRRSKYIDDSYADGVRPCDETISVYFAMLLQRCLEFSHQPY